MHFCRWQAVHCFFLDKAAAQGGFGTAYGADGAEPARARCPVRTDTEIEANKNLPIPSQNREFYSVKKEMFSIKLPHPLTPSPKGRGKEGRCCRTLPVPSPLSLRDVSPPVESSPQPALLRSAFAMRGALLLPESSRKKCRHNCMLWVQAP